jgi:hypothetical protein
MTSPDQHLKSEYVYAFSAALTNLCLLAYIWRVIHFNYDSYLKRNRIGLTSFYLGILYLFSFLVENIM